LKLDFSLESFDAFSAEYLLEEVMRGPFLRALALAVIAISVFFATANLALADRSYHTERLSFHALNGAPNLRDGHVINAHSNGPIRYAREGYMVNGAAPNTSYDVFIQVFFDNACESAPDLALQTATLETDANGNGHAYHVFIPADVVPFNPPLTVHARWVLEVGGTAQYETDCTVINLD